MNGFLGTGNGHSEQRTTAGGDPPGNPGGTGLDPIGRQFLAFDPAAGPDSAVIVEMAPTATSRLAIRNIRTIMGDQGQ